VVRGSPGHRQNNNKREKENRMKVLILADGHGTQLSEQGPVVPKPLIEIGGRPILWHIMRIYSHHGLNEFVICCGCNGSVIKDYFLNCMPYPRHSTLDLQNHAIEFHRSASEPWQVTLVETDQKTMSSKRLKDYTGGTTFCLTYGESLSDVNIRELIRFHRRQGALATVTAVRERSRFAAVNTSPERQRAARLLDKDTSSELVINGGFFVLEPDSLDVVERDSTSWESDLFARLIQQDQLAVYRHRGYLQKMDTPLDRDVLQRQWDSGTPPWCVWNDEHAKSPEDLSSGAQTVRTAEA
jgi:glucose-1-phosphate cytidylyltransferase